MEIYFRYPCSNRAFTGIVFLFVLIFGMNANLPVPVVIGDDRMVTPRFISLPDLQSQIVCTVLSALAGFSGNSVSESV